MQVDNPLYKNQGIHVIVSLLTVSENKFKVLLIKRKKEPFKDYWCLLGGAVFNNESLEVAVVRELEEKSGIRNVEPEFFGLFSNPERAKETGFRMLGVGYLALVDDSAIQCIKESEKAKEISWWDIDKIPGLAYDHSLILSKAVEFLKSQIFKSDIIKTLFPKYVTLPELQNVYEKITGKVYDRRNFRKKVLSIGLISDVGLLRETGKKPAKLYVINQIKEEITL